MNAEQVRDWHRERQRDHASERDGCMGRYHAIRESRHKEMADAIDAQLAQPAQLWEMKQRACRAHALCNELRLAHPEIPELGDDGVLHEAIHDILRVDTPTAAPAQAMQIDKCGVCDGPNAYDPESGVCRKCQNVAAPTAEQWAEGIYRRHTDGSVWYVHPSIANTPDWVRDSEVYRMRHEPLPPPTTEQMAAKIAEAGKGVEMIDAICKALNMAIYMEDGKLVLKDAAKVCPNCDSPLPKGCEGTFRGQPECQLPKYVYQCQNSAGVWDEIDRADYFNQPVNQRRVVVVVPEP